MEIRKNDVNPIAFIPPAPDQPPPPPTKIEQISTIRKILNAIKSFFKKIGEFFKNLFRKRVTLNDRQKKRILELNQASLVDSGSSKRHRIKRYTQDDSQLTVKDQPTEISLEALNLEVRSKQTPAKTKKKARRNTLQNRKVRVLGTQLNRLTNTTLQTVYNKKVKPAFTSVKEAKEDLIKNLLTQKETIQIEVEKIEASSNAEKGTVSKGVNFITELLLKQIGDKNKAGESLLSKGLKFIAETVIHFGDEKEKLFFQVLSKFSVEAKPKSNSDVQKLINWLTKDLNCNEFHEQYMPPTIEGVNTAEYAKKCIKWLGSNQTNPLSIQCIGMSAQHLKTVFDNVMFGLLKYKIGQFAIQCEERLIDRFPIIVHDILVKKGGAVTEALIHRMCSVIEKTSFPNLFNNFVAITQEHVKGVIALEKAKKNEFKLLDDDIKKAKQAQNPSVRVSLGDKKIFDALLKNVVKGGGEENYKKTRAMKVGVETYAHEKICDKNIEQLINEPKSAEKNEQQLFDNIAVEVLPILFPDQEVLLEGKMQKVNGIMLLLSQADFLEEFREPFLEFNSILEKILSTSASRNLKKAKKPVSEITKFIDTYLQEIITTELKKKISNGAKQLYEQVTNPIQMKKMMGLYILPMIQNQILIVLAKNEFEKSAALFYDKILNEKNNFDDISDKIYLGVQKSTEQYKNEFNSLGKESFKKLIAKELKLAQEFIITYHGNKKKLTPESFTVESVKTSLEEYLKITDEGENPRFGELIQDLMFDLGEFGKSGTEFLFTFFKKDISKVITNATRDIQASPDFLVDMITDELKAIEKKTVIDLVLNKKAEAPCIDVEKTWKDEIAKTAKITHDLIFRQIPGGFIGLFARPAARKFLHKDHTHLEKVITNVFNKLFGNHDSKGKDRITQNLIYKSQNAIFNALREGAQKVNLENKLNIVKIETQPSIFPSF